MTDSFFVRTNSIFLRTDSFFVTTDSFFVTTDSIFVTTDSVFVTSDSIFVHLHWFSQRHRFNFCHDRLIFCHDQFNFWRKKDEKIYFYIIMAEIKWVTPIATATAIAKSEWKRELEKISALFESWRKQLPHDTEMDWLFYSGRQGIRSRTAWHVWDVHRTTTKTRTPYAQSLKKPKKTKKRPYDLSTTREIGHVNHMTGYPFNIWPLALTIHCVTEWGPSRKTSLRLYPAKNMTYLESLLR